MHFPSASTRFPLSPCFCVRTALVSGPRRRRSAGTKVISVCPGIEVFCLALTLDRKGHGKTTSLMETGGTIQLKGRIAPRAGAPAFYAG